VLPKLFVTNSQSVYANSKLCNTEQVRFRSLPRDILQAELTVPAAQAGLASGSVIAHTPATGIL